MSSMRRRSHSNFRIPAGLLLMLLWVLLFTAMADNLRDRSAQQQEFSLELAIDHAITSCYALEGIYPPDLQYMKDHYGLVYDEELFYVDYRPIASNMRPEVYVLPLTDSVNSSLSLKGGRQ